VCFSQWQYDSSTAVMTVISGSLKSAITDPVWMDSALEQWDLTTSHCSCLLSHAGSIAQLVLDCWWVRHIATWSPVTGWIC
jgi:hypothetical protein